MNKLYYGDCLAVMENMDLESVDLIYLDPPFNSNRSYNAIYKDNTGQPLPEQVEAFCDVWELNEERIKTLTEIPVLMRAAGVDDGAVELWQLWMKALRHTQPKLLAYLSYMTERILVMKKIMKPTASIYLHCDPTASHYIKTLMDAIFGHQNFRNEIIWCYRQGGRSKKTFAKKHDVLLWYTNSNNWTFNPDKIRIPYEGTGGYVSTGRNIINGKEYKTNPLGKIPEDWWDIPALNPMSKERLGYPTQKPIALLKRIILASSNEGDVIFDPFCGCATTICAAHELKRKWIGIDIAYHAIRRVVQQRLKDVYHLKEGEHYTVNGLPTTRESAVDLWNRDKYQFQRWAVETIDGFVTTKKGSDGGIDGRLYFKSTDKKSLCSMVLEVKGGENIGISTVRDLRGVLERSGAEMAGLIVRDISERKRKNFQDEMLSAGFIDNKYPKMQLLTLDEILEGKKFRTPSVEGQGVGQGVLI